MAVCLWSGAALAQGGRFDGIAQSTTTVGAATVVVPLPGATITACSHPATGQTSTTPCTNKITTYTDATLGSACPTTTQVVLAGTSSCVAAADAQGNYGFWVPAGGYDYSICASGACSTPNYAYVGLQPTNNTNNSFTGTNTVGLLNGTYYLSSCQVSPAPAWCGGGSDLGGWYNGAEAALSPGGTIVLPQTSSCIVFTTPIVINKPIRTLGQGSGSALTQIQIEGAVEPSCIKWGATSGDAISVNLPASNLLWGVWFEGFTLRGNKDVGGVTTGSGIVFNGGNAGTQMDNFGAMNVTVRGFKEYGWRLRDNVFIGDFYACKSIGNVLDGWSVDQTGLLGVPSQLRWYGGMSLQNGRDGYRIGTGASNESIELHAVTTSNNTGNGVTANVGIYVFGGGHENNAWNGIQLNAGASGSNLVSATAPTNTGFGIDNFAADVLISGFQKSNSTAGDIKIETGANDTRIVGAANNLVITDNGNRTSQDHGNLGVWHSRNPACVQFYADSTHNNKLCRDTVSGGLIFTPEPAGIFTISTNAVVSGGTITGGASGLTLNAGGSGQNVTLTPTGAGVVNIAAANLFAQGGAKIGGAGTLITADYRGTGTLTYTAITAATCQEQPLTITGAAAGDACFASTGASDMGVNFAYSGCRISAANTAQVKVCSAATATPTAVAWTGWARH